MTIPSQITNPKGCNQKFGLDSFKLDIICGAYTNLCPQCKNIQRAQAQVLLDEKKSELEFLQSITARTIGNGFKRVMGKIQELQEEIKILEGVLK